MRVNLLTDSELRLAIDSLLAISQQARDHGRPLHYTEARRGLVLLEDERRRREQARSQAAR